MRSSRLIIQQAFNPLQLLCGEQVVFQSSLKFPYKWAIVTLLGSCLWSGKVAFVIPPSFLFEIPL